MNIGAKVNYLNYRDNINRKNYYKTEISRFFFKTFVSDKRLKFNVRFFVRFAFLYRRKCALVKIRNRCLLTGRSRFVLRYFRLSRASFRDLARFGFISGIKKSI